MKQSTLFTTLITIVIVLLLSVSSPSSSLVFSATTTTSSSSSIPNLKIISVISTTGSEDYGNSAPKKRGYSASILSAPVTISSSFNKDDGGGVETLIFIATQSARAQLWSVPSSSSNQKAVLVWKTDENLSAPARATPAVWQRKNRNGNNNNNNNNNKNAIIFLPLQDGSVIAFDVTSKKILWKQTEAAKSWGFTPLLLENVNDVDSENKNNNANSGIDGGVLFVGFRDDHVAAFDAETGRVIGKVAAPADGVWSAPTVDPETRTRLYFARTASTQIVCADISMLSSSLSSSLSKRTSSSKSNEDQKQQQQEELLSFPILWTYDIVEKATNYRQQIPFWIWTSPIRVCRMKQQCSIFFGCVDGVLRAVKDISSSSPKVIKTNNEMISFKSKLPPAKEGISLNPLQISSRNVLSISNKGQILLVKSSSSGGDADVSFVEKKVKVVSSSSSSSPIMTASDDEVIMFSKLSNNNEEAVGVEDELALVLVVTKKCRIRYLKLETEEANKGVIIAQSISPTTNEDGNEDVSLVLSSKLSAGETCSSAKYSINDGLLAIGTTKGGVILISTGVGTNDAKNTNREEADGNKGSSFTPPVPGGSSSSSSSSPAVVVTSVEKDSTMILTVAAIALVGAVLLVRYYRK